MVCEQMLCGRQSVILRKGGIAEGRGGFSFQHRSFYLLPTFFHEQLERTTLPSDTRLPGGRAGELRIAGMCEVVRVARIAERSLLEPLAALHVLAPRTVNERFQFGKSPGLQVALTRVYRLDPAWTLADDPRYGGCKSWVELPEPPAARRRAVLDDDAFERLRGRFEAIVGGNAVNA